MRLPTYAIGIDSSTTATKAVVWDQDGRSVAEGRCAFPLTKPRPGWHEQDAEDWWRSTVTALREVAAAVDSRQIGAIGLTHQRETFVCVGEDGRPLRPAIMWLDSRSAPQVKEYGSERMHRITGKVPDPTPALYKLYWLRDHEPGLLERSRKVVDVHGFLVHRLTGNWRTSWATADPLGLVDMESFDWSDEILSGLNLGRFFFSSRRRHTRYWRDWSSDVYSSDLGCADAGGGGGGCYDRFVCRARAVSEPDRRDHACCGRNEEGEERGPNPVAGIPAEPAAPGGPQQCDGTRGRGKPMAALEAVLLPPAVRSAAARAAPFILLGTQGLPLPGIDASLPRGVDDRLVRSGQLGFALGLEVEHRLCLLLRFCLRLCRCLCLRPGFLGGLGGAAA